MMTLRDCTVDVHCHTWWSYDGFTSFGELHKWQRDRGVVICAVTEHDTLDGWWAEGSAMAVREPWVVPGVELSCCLTNRGLGILAVGIDPHDSNLASFLREETALDARELAEWCSAVRRRFGVDISKILAEWATHLFPDFPARVQRYVPEWIRKRLLVVAGIASTSELATEVHESLKSQLPRRELPTASRVIGLVHSAGGLAFLEHPEAGFNDDHAHSLQRLGIDGIEAYSGHLSATEREHWIAFCKNKGLLTVAGSDHHGMRSDWGRNGLPCPHPRAVLDEFLQRLRHTHWGLGHQEACSELEKCLARHEA